MSEETLPVFPLTWRICVAGVLAAACTGWVHAEPVLSSTQRSQMAVLRDKARADWRESQVHKDNADYGPIFLVLALHDPDPVAVNRWLVLADGVYSSKPEATRSRRLEQIGEDFRSVALWASRHKDDNIRNSAMSMLSNCLGQPDPQAQQRAIECALRDTNPAVRAGAIHSFWFPVNFQPVVDAAVAECLLQCLKDRHPHPITSALEICRRTYRKKRRFPASLEPRLDGQLRQLLGHQEAVVCGHAVQALSLLHQSREEDTGPWLYPLLTHRHPFVRGSALEALEEAANPRSLKRAMALLDDTALAEVSQPLPDTGSGIQASLNYTPSNRHCSVQEWALRAIQQASARTAYPFQFETASPAGKRADKGVTLRVGRAGPDAEQQAKLLLKVREARQWWSQHAASLGPQD